MTVRFNKIARHELGAQIAYIATANPAAATRLAGATQRALALLDSGIVEGAEIELQAGRRVKRWLVPPIVIFYVREQDGIRIVRVRHGAQQALAG